MLKYKAILHTTFVYIYIQMPTSTYYAKKKTLAEGLMDVGLMIANASQLKALLSVGSSHQFYWALLVLLCLSLLLQVIIGILLIMLVVTEENDEETKSAGNINNATVGMIFVVTIINVFVGAFGIELSGNTT